MSDKEQSNNSAVSLAVLFGCAAAVIPGAIISFVDEGNAGDLSLLLSRLLLLAALEGVTVAVLTVPKLRIYYVFLAAQLLLGVLFVRAFALFPIAWVPVLTFCILEVSFLEPYPTSLLVSLGTLAGCLVLLLAVAYPFRAHAFSEGMSALAPTLPLAGLATLGPLVTRYRELAAQTLDEVEQLGDSVVRLTRANSEYQDFALLATERSAEQERLRITRDIHDVVGYTLTNNIMLMEAALRLMHENVLALPTIIETARTNAREGLVSIRSALYVLRDSEPQYPSGLKAISRLVRMFEQATNVRVRCEFGNMPWSISSDVDAALYHLVQECLVNSYRHGKATQVQITFWRNAEWLQVDIDDDGVGATETAEGIGIRGMHERMEALGGSLSVTPAAVGFAVRARIPLGDEKNE